MADATRASLGRTSVGRRKKPRTTEARLMRPDQLPQADREALKRGHYPDQSKLMAPEDLPFIERLFRGEEMPFDIGGPVKSLARAAGKVRVARLTGAEGAYFNDLTRADIKELKELVPSIRAFGSRRDKTGRFEEVPLTLEIAEKDMSGLVEYLESTWRLESRAVGGPGTSTLPPTFARPELLLNRFK